MTPVNAIKSRTRSEKIWKPTAREIAAAHDKRVPAVLGPDLKLLFVGINPGLYTAAVGHHFARPGNRFWPALYRAGFVDRPLTAFDDRELPAYGLGITNIVERATARADELGADELIAGARRLEKIVKRHRVRAVAFLGVTAYRIALEKPRAKVGPAEERLAQARVWVLPNPSGLNAHYQLADFVRMFRDLRDALS
jgi:TDG/mug DNA glycosylase family protein